MKPQVITVMAAVILLAACGGSPSTTGSGGAQTSASVATYTQCMRSHGVADYPGPTNGQLPKIFSGQQVGVSDSRLSTAQKACQALWPYQGLTQAQLQQQLTQDVKFAQCMRSHGLPGFPDPTAQDGRPVFEISSTGGIDLHSAQVLAKAHECLHVLPPGAPLPSATQVP